MRRLIVLIAVSLVATQSVAATWTNGTQIVASVIWVPGYHGFYSTSTTFHDPENCGGAFNRLYLFDPSMDEKTVDRLYAMLLTAGTATKTVFVWVDGCVGTAPKIRGLQIDN